MSQINELIKAAHASAAKKGWWDPEPSFGELISLIHSEASEALEDYRNGRDITEVWYENKELKTRLSDPITPNCKPCGIPSELADIVIRVFDACGRYGIDLERAIKEKMAYNATRPIRHGGKKL
jgi:NTP pyrophosphatase (non-canonical NTP hydrolase)